MLICLDLETTGLDKYNDKIIEVAMIKFDEKTFEIIDTYSCFVDPGIDIPEIISNITNIFDNDVEGAPYIEDLREEIKSFIGDLPILGHNVNFDTDFLIRNGIDISNNYKLDTFFLANILSFKEKSLNLEVLCNSYGLGFSGAHRALNDVNATIKLFERQIKEFSKLNKTKTQLVKYLFSLSPDKNIAYLNELLFKTTSIDNFESFENLLLKKVGKFKEIDSLPVDYNFEVGDLENHFNFSEGFEKRDNQLEMSKGVFSSLTDRKNIVIEAPTGLGKSFAYLIPSVIHSIKSGEKVYISTKTKTLQDQLYDKDLHFLERNLDIDFTFTKLKGKRNYLSLKGYFDMVVLGDLSYNEVGLYSKIALWLLETKFGELDELNFYGEEFSIIRDLNSEGFNILTEKNNYQIYEFLYKARKRLEKSNLVVINHSLLFADLENDGQVLGGIKNLVIDEAHNIEDSVTESVKQRYSLNALKDHFDRIEKIFIKKGIKKIDFLNLKEVVVSNLEILDDYSYEYVNSKVKEDNSYKSVLLSEDFFGGIEYEKIIQKVKLSLIDIVDKLKVIDEYDFSREVVFIDSQAKNLDIIYTRQIDEKFIKIINYNEKQGVTIDYTLLNPGNYLIKNLWNNLNSCILTSATLKIGNSFDYIKSILSLDDFKFYSFESDFDYKKQATLFIPTDIGSIKNNNKEIVEFLKDFYLIVKGQVLTLLTSFNIIKQIYTHTNIELKKNGINLHAQSIGGSKMKLLTFFLDSPENSILLGTDSFWEGVDIPGEDLKYLVIHKFPFGVPTDPVFKARSVFFSDPFSEYAIPKAIIKLKQGFGRLIRKKTDKGLVVLLDDRISSTRWGEAFYDAFPSEINIKKGTKNNFLEILKNI